MMLRFASQFLTLNRLLAMSTKPHARAPIRANLSRAEVRSLGLPSARNLRLAPRSSITAFDLDQFMPKPVGTIAPKLSI